MMYSKNYLIWVISLALRALHFTPDRRIDHSCQRIEIVVEITQTFACGQSR